MAKKDDYAPASNDAYTGMLSISLVALIGACVLLFLDYSQYPDSKPPNFVRTPPDKKPDMPGAPVAPIPKDNVKKDDAPKKEDPKKEEPKKEDAKKDDVKKEDAKKDEPKKDDPKKDDDK